MSTLIRARLPVDFGKVKVLCLLLFVKYDRVDLYYASLRKVNDCLEWMLGRGDGNLQYSNSFATEYSFSKSL